MDLVIITITDFTTLNSGSTTLTTVATPKSSIASMATSVVTSIHSDSALKSFMSSAPTSTVSRTPLASDATLDLVHPNNAIAILTIIIIAIVSLLFLIAISLVFWKVVIRGKCLECNQKEEDLRKFMKGDPITVAMVRERENLTHKHEQEKAAAMPAGARTFSTSEGQQADIKISPTFEGNKLSSVVTASTHSVASEICRARPAEANRASALSELEGRTAMPDSREQDRDFMDNALAIWKRTLGIAGLDNFGLAEGRKREKWPVKRVVEDADPELGHVGVTHAKLQRPLSAYIQPRSVQQRYDSYTTDRHAESPIADDSDAVSPIYQEPRTTYSKYHKPFAENIIDKDMGNTCGISRSSELYEDSPPNITYVPKTTAKAGFNPYGGMMEQIAADDLAINYRRACYNAGRQDLDTTNREEARKSVHKIYEQIQKRRRSGAYGNMPPPPTPPV